MGGIKGPDLVPRTPRIGDKSKPRLGLGGVLFWACGDNLFQPVLQAGNDASILVCVASLPHAAQTSFVCSSSFTNSIVLTRMSFWQERQIQIGGSACRGKGIGASVCC